MRIKSMNTISVLLCTFFVLVSFASCSDDGQSIFWSIINAQEEEDHSLENNLTIVSMTDDGNYYYIATGGSIRRQDMTLPTDEVWGHISFPGDTIFCTSMIYYNSLLYAGFIKSNGSGGLYTCPNPSTDSPSWTEEIDADEDIRNKQIVRLKIVNSRLFVSLQEPENSDGKYTYSVYYFDDIDDYVPVTGLMNKTEPVIGLIYDTSNYWAIAGSLVLRGPLTNMVALTDTDDDPSPHDYGGIFYSSAGNYFLSTEEGKVYMYDGIDWTSSDTLDELGHVVSLTEFAEINGNVLVGSQAYGFYEMQDGTVGDLHRSDVNSASIVSSDLFSSHVLSFYMSTLNRVFFCTGGDGLYHNIYDGEWTDNWIRE